jgi:hypothetical protein
MESYVNLTDNRTESIASGTAQQIFAIDLSDFGTGQAVSIEMFVLIVSQGQTSSLYIRQSQTLVTGDTIQGQDTGGDSKWYYNQSITGCTHSLTYEYDQGASTIRIKADNSFGATDSVSYQYNAVLNYE